MMNAILQLFHQDLSQLSLLDVKATEPREFLTTEHKDQIAGPALHVVILYGLWYGYLFVIHCQWCGLAWV